MAVVRTIQISAKTFNTASPDGKYAYAGERDITILDVHQGEEQCKLSGHDWGVHSVVVTPDGRRAFSGSADKTVRVWDLQTRQTLAVLPHPEQVRTVVAKANGSLILSGTQDGTLRLWDVDRAVAATVAEETVGVGSVAVTPNELYAASSHAQRIQVWDLKQKAKLYTLSGHEDEVTSLVATTDSLRVVSGSCDGTIRVWDLERGVEAFRLSGHRGWIKLAVHPNGRIIISAAQDGTVGVWDLDLKKRLCTLDAHEGPIFSLAVTPDGQQAVVGYALWDDFIKIWDLSPLTRHQINGPQPVLEKRSVMLKNSKKTLLSRFKKMSIENHVESGVIGLSVTPGGHRLVAASTNGELHIWDLTRGVKMCILKGHEDRAVTVVVLSDGQRAVSASPDHTIRLWDLDSGDPLVTFTGDSGFTACAVAPQSGTIVAGDSSGRVHFFEDIQVAGIAKPSRSLSPTNRKKLSRTTDTRMRASDRIFEFTYSLLPRIPTIALIGVFIGAGYGVRGGFWKGLLYGCAGGIAAAVAAGLLLLAVWVFLGLPSMLWDRSRGRRWSKWH
jgi:WD40 repeat protein